MDNCDDNEILTKLRNINEAALRLRSFIPGVAKDSLQKVCLLIISTYYHEINWIIEGRCH